MHYMHFIMMYMIFLIMYTLFNDHNNTISISITLDIYYFGLEAFKILSITNFVEYKLSAMIFYCAVKIYFLTFKVSGKQQLSNWT